MMSTVNKHYFTDQRFATISLAREHQLHLPPSISINLVHPTHGTWNWKWLVSSNTRESIQLSPIAKKDNSPLRSMQCIRNDLGLVIVLKRMPPTKTFQRYSKCLFAQSLCAVLMSVKGGVDTMCELHQFFRRFFLLFTNLPQLKFLRRH